MKTDLHSHSIYSDGKFSPTELVLKAKEAGIENFALTDHDTIKGVKECMESGKELGINVISGIELSSINIGDVHILGYGINCDSVKLNQKLDNVIKLRDYRNEVIMKKIAEAGFCFDLNELLTYAKGKVVGRSHIAELMVKYGYVKSVNEGFEKYLGTGKKFYAKTERLSPYECIELILEAGGIPVLAHPNRLNITKSAIDDYVKELKDHGLMGIEGYYYTHNEWDVKFYEDMAKRYDLLITGGSDFHSDGRKNSLGIIAKEVEIDTIKILSRTKND